MTCSKADGDLQTWESRRDKALFPGAQRSAGIRQRAEDRQSATRRWFSDSWGLRNRIDRGICEVEGRAAQVVQGVQTVMTARGGRSWQRRSSGKRTVVGRPDAGDTAVEHGAILVEMADTHVK